MLHSVGVTPLHLWYALHGQKGVLKDNKSAFVAGTVVEMLSLPVFNVVICNCLKTELTGSLSFYSYS